MREFSTAGRRSEPAFPDALPIEFKVDGDVFMAYPPTAGAMAIMLAAQADSRDASESIAGIIDFFDGMLDEEAQVVFRRRLLDRDDPFDFDMVNEIMEGLIEEWSARPTKSPSASASSRADGGPRSTAKRPSRARTS